MMKSARSPERSSLFSLLWVMLFDHASLNIVFPVLTLLFFDADSRLFASNASFAARSFWYGLCISLPHAVNFFSVPLLSVLSDRFGRKNILIVATLGALAFGLMGAVSVLSGSLILLFGASLLRGIFSRSNPVAQAAIGDISPPAKKMVYMGYLQAAISMGAFIGPVIGGYFARGIDFGLLNFSLPFFIAAGFAVIACVLTVTGFSETLTERHAHSPWQMMRWQSLKMLFANRRIIAISLVLLLSQVSWSLYYQFMPPLMKNVLHADAHQIGYFVGLVAFWLALGSMFGIRVLNAFWDLSGVLMFSLWMIFAGTVLTLLFFLLHLSPGWHWLVWVSAIPVAMGDVMAFSCLCTLYSDAVPAIEQGKVMGLCFVVIALVWMVSGVLGGLLMAVHPLLPLVMAPLGILAALWIDKSGCRS